MKKTNNKKLGSIGEDISANIIREKGFTILQRNFRCKTGEIDIIACDNQIIIFIEVKTRTSKQYGTPEEAVDYRKQRRLKMLAEIYLANNNMMGCYCRFDVYSIYMNSDCDEVKAVKIFENCF